MDFFPLRTYSYQPCSRVVAKKRRLLDMEDIFPLVFMDILSEKAAKRKRQDVWKYTIELQKYQKDDVEVERKETVVYVSAKRTFGDEENCDVYQTKRRVPLPDDVESNKMTHSFLRGRLTLEAPYKKVEMQEEKSETEKGASKCVMDGCCLEIEKSDKTNKTINLEDKKDENEADKKEENKKEDNDEDDKADKEVEHITSHPVVELPEEEEEVGTYDVTMELSSFDPGDIKVTCEDSTVKVKAKSEQKHEDGGVMSRSFYRELTLPQDVDADRVKCIMGKEGGLQITAPRKAEATQNNGKGVLMVNMES